MKTKKRKRTRIAYVRWFDSAITQGAVCGPEDACGVLENESVGIIVKETKRAITVALDRCLGTGGLRCTICIPWVNVRSVQRFRARRS